ncbi:1-acyl-sn-glycerol-3-phosphate acyltransferase [Paenibacillus phyllosphaerae]|uniref:1-acyl-sn-glycerol-3-phosphate acyltransferase n=1 Tax=Paenibacillus phyllosphaerae TaxID=274593 RepID=A0A7W5AVY0_9BACL|nr:lysophospholipid acyltransferase family protein [Paenibacillus phyllosphaerae]MBB3109261.1 1-acyl-sn-glycerol-3-phosphate acyltransferase [Paenibacillus phyllosphaerae]
MIYVFVRWLLRVFYSVVFRFEAVGLENIPATGPVVLCSNHISNFDPPTVGIKVKRKVHYMAKAELFEIPVFGSLIRALGAFPVKRGGVSKDAIRSAIALLENGGVMGIFPEGSRKAPSGMGKKGAAMIAMRSHATVIPVAVIGTYKPFRKMIIRYGQPIDMAAFIQDSSSDVLERVTEEIMANIREMVRQG